MSFSRRLTALAAVLTLAGLGAVGSAGASGASGPPIFEVDETFGNAGTVTIAPAAWTYLQDMAVQPDGRAVVVGGYSGTAFVMRRLADGNPDPGFGSGGQATVPGNYAQATAVTVDSAGRILVAGLMENRNFVARFTSGGSLDPTFGAGGVAELYVGTITAFNVDGAGRVVYAGPTAGYTNSVTVGRLTAAGTTDTSFGTGGSAVMVLPALFGQNGRTSVGRIAAAPDGRVVVVGALYSTETQSAQGSVPYVFRLLESGTADGGFGAGGAAVGGFSRPSDWGIGFYDLSINPDGSIVAAGSTGRVPTGNIGERGVFLARYDAAGHLDPSYGYATGAFRAADGNGNGGLTVMNGVGGRHELVSDGAGGWLLPVRGDDTFREGTIALVRFDSAGRPDASFDDDGFLLVDPSRDHSESGTVTGVAPGGRVVLASSSMRSGVPTVPFQGSIFMTRIQPPPHRQGYWMLGDDGSLWAFGNAPLKGLPGPGYHWVDVEPTPTGAGYWSLASNGTVFSFGNATKLTGVWPPLDGEEKAASLSATPSGKGYWVFTTKGRVFPFGDAGPFGDMAKVKLNGPVLDSVATPTGRGYFMVASDGGIFAFGDAVFTGSMGGKRLNAPVQSLVPDGDGAGYWLVASDGGVFAFGAPFRGSMGGRPLNGPVTGMVRFGNGYLMVGTDGGIFNFSDKEFFGSLGGQKLKTTITAVAAIDT